MTDEAPVKMPRMSGSDVERVDPTTTRVLTEVVNRLRRTLRTSIRADYPWETLPMAQVELLMALQDQPSRVGDLAARLRLAGNTVSTLVQQLVEAGFVHRSSDAADRRAAVIALTDAGRSQLAGWDAAHQQRIGDALRELSPADRTAIQAALPALDHLVEELAGRRRP